MLLPFSVLAAVPFVMVLGNSMLIPVFPTMQAEMGLTQFQVGLLVTAFSIPAGLLIPFAGALSDYVGRKAIMTPALIVYGLGGLVAGAAALLLAKPFTLILVGRILQGIGAGGTYQIALALTGDVFTSQERSKAVGLLEAANGTGKVVSPILGSLFALISWYTPFFVYGLLSIPIALAVWWIVKEPKQAKGKRPVAQYTKALKEIFARKGTGLIAAYLAGMSGLFLLFGLLSFLSDELEANFGIRDFAKGFVLAVPVGIMAITSYLTGLFLQNRQKWLKPVILAGLILTAAAFALLTLFDGLVPSMVLISVIGLGIGATLPPINTLVTGAASSSERGLVTSLYGTVRFFGVALGPPTFGLIVGMGRLPMFLGAAAVSTLAALCAFLFVKPDKILVGQDAAEQTGSDPADPGSQERNGHLEQRLQNGTLDGRSPKHPTNERDEHPGPEIEREQERKPEPSPTR